MKYQYLIFSLFFMVIVLPAMVSASYSSCKKTCKSDFDTCSKNATTNRQVKRCRRTKARCLDYCNQDYMYAFIFQSRNENWIWDELLSNWDGQTGTVVTDYKLSNMCGNLGLERLRFYRGAATNKKMVHLKRNVPTWSDFNWAGQATKHSTFVGAKGLKWTVFALGTTSGDYLKWSCAHPEQSSLFRKKGMPYVQSGPLYIALTYWKRHLYWMPRQHSTGIHWDALDFSPPTSERNYVYRMTKFTDPNGTGPLGGTTNCDFQRCWDGVGCGQCKCTCPEESMTPLFEDVRIGCVGSYRATCSSYWRIEDGFSG